MSFVGLVSHASGDAFALSTAGNSVAFTSTKSNVVPGMVQIASRNVFLFDRAAGITTLASRRAGTTLTSGDGSSVQPSLSADGRFLAFASDGTASLHERLRGRRRLPELCHQPRPGRLQPHGGRLRVLHSLRGGRRLLQHRGPLPPGGHARRSGTVGCSRPRSKFVSDIRPDLRCAIPSDAVAVSANVTVVNPAAAGELRFYPAGFSAGGTSTASFATGQVRANNAILALGAGGATAVDAVTAGSVDLVIDVNGYFR
ncbi:MAG: PD40 domain-containing protein [Holophagales bacterium]|nr:PD40 domain-containing protein [Holophagales bacterium]